VPDLDQPAIGKIAPPHLLLCEPRRRMICVHGHVLVVMRIVNIVHPGVPLSDGVERIVRSRWQRLIIGVNYPNSEAAGGRPVILFHLYGPLILANEQSSSPG
jgi:hypothetical protein